MKRITYAGGSIITGNAVTEALLEYATSIGSDAGTVAVEIPVLESDGKTTIHTVLLGPGMQFDVSDIDILSEQEEARLFPVPELPSVGIVAVTGSSAQAGKDADAFDRAVAYIDNGLNDDHEV